MAAIDDKQRATADWLVRELVSAAPDRSAVWNLAGAVGSGKTSVLRLVEGALHAHGLIPLMVSAPAAEVDAAPIALLETAAQLKAAQLLNGETATLSDPACRWDDKMAAITSAVDRHRNEVVVLCDEPTRWYHQQESLLDDLPDHSARAFAEWIAEHAKCRRVISGSIPNEVSPRGQTRAPRFEDGRPFLAEDGRWGETATLANELTRALSQPLPHRSLWEMRLLVALSRFKTPGEVAAQAMRGSPAALLLEELLDLLERDTSSRPTCEALARLTLPRTPVDQQVFDALTQGLSRLDRDLIAACLCELDRDRLTLHPLVRYEIVTRARDPRRWQTNAQWRLSAPDRQAVHRRLKEVYERGDVISFRNQLESLHHELLGGGSGLPEGDVRLRFVEQLHEIGRTLSYVHHEHRRAAAVFRLALKIDPTHPYSHHYLAFNLDWLAEEPEEVEAHYREAIRLQPAHPWWWSRWISYLATRGRFRQAQAAWRDALDAMSVSEDGSPRWLFLSLHRWVARWLLHWAELDFAEDVLRSIPTDVAESDASIRVLWDVLAALREAERGVAVFPLTVPAKDWWSPTPHTDLPLKWEDRPLRSWMPARVESVDKLAGRVFLMAAERPATQKDPLVYEEIELTQGEVQSAAHHFSWDELREGRFVELARYGDDGVCRIGLHRETVWRDRLLIPLVPPPDRWFQHAVSAASSPTGKPA